MKLFILNCLYRKKQRNGNNNVRNKKANSTPLKEDMHTVQTQISHQVLLVTLETRALQNPALQYRQNIFKKPEHLKSEFKEMSFTSRQRNCLHSFLTYLYSTVHLPPSSGFRTALDIPLTDSPPNLHSTSHSPSHTVTLHSSI